jgi:hypothetical protein
LVQPDGGNVGHEVRLSKLIRTPPNFGEADVFGNAESSAGVPVIKMGAACVSRGVSSRSGMKSRVLIFTVGFFLEAVKRNKRV